MSSTFVYFEDISQKSKEYILDEPPKSPIWLQFVTGKVTGVITEGNSMAASGDGDTNCVMAKPHVGSDLLSSGTLFKLDCCLSEILQSVICAQCYYWPLCFVEAWRSPLQNKGLVP